MQFQVEFYETEDGKRPTQEFLDSLEPKMNAKMVGLIFVEQRIIITHGFIKKTVKTPRAQIDRAKQYREDFLKREKKRKQVKK